MAFMRGSGVAGLLGTLWERAGRSAIRGGRHGSGLAKHFHRSSRRRGLALLTLALLFATGPASAGSILFIGNSFTFSAGSPVRYYRPDSVTDLNSLGIGGMPALFKSFTQQAGLSYDVFLETEPGVGIDWHLGHRLGIIGQRPWDAVVMHGYSTLDAATPGTKPVLPVGEAWLRAMQTGVADPNPYDGVEPGKLNLWTYDSYHASTFGYYLEALVVFSSVTGRDPRSLGANECSGFELGLSPPQVGALQQVAFDQLAAGGRVTPAPLVLPRAVEPSRCVRTR